MQKMKLKACPFCGGHASVMEGASYSNETVWYVECDRCHVKCCHSLTGETAALRWNCRSQKAVDEPEENHELNALLYDYAKSIREEDGMAEIHAHSIRQFLAAIPADIMKTLNSVRAIQDIAVHNPWKGGSQAYLATEHWNEGWTECVQEVMTRLNGE